MRILFSLTYYTPHVSGLTIYVERLASAFAERGHQVTVLTSRHRPELPTDEIVGGVRIVRVPVVASVGKGPLMPQFGPKAAQLLGDHDIASLHLPQVESPLVAAPARTLGKPVVLTYHCDLDLPPGRLNAGVGRIVDGANHLSGRLADAVVAYTDDYAEHSPFLRRWRDKRVVIGPPVTMPAPTAEEVAAFRASHGVGTGPVLGFASRFATEKGIEYAIEAAPSLIRDYPDLRILFAGPYREVIGEDDYRERLRPKIDALGDHWRFLGTLGSHQLPAFYGSLDALLMTSVNSTESFGLVQVESMLCGTPVVATNLPGVRQPVTMTGMGEIVQIADAASLETGIRKVLANRDAYRRPRADIEALFDPSVTVASYEALFDRLIEEKRQAV
ncbi:MAG: glycosyltransferase family 4 protein [Thermomicrobiales bacterium]|nr:glycosyltransferase family 4 protein [Thermomicrobiales bacterium]